MKITKQQIKNLDVQTLTAAIDWLFDSNRRFALSGAVGRMSKSKTEYEMAMNNCRKHCLERLVHLFEIASGRADCAESFDLLTCPRCDSCGCPIIQNYGDEYSNLCKCCAGVYLTGDDAVEFIKQKTKEVK